MGSMPYLTYWYSLHTPLVKWQINFKKINIFPRWLSGKESACQCRRPRFNSWVGKIPWRRKWQPTPVFLPGESHGQRSLAGCSPRGCKELQMSNWACPHVVFDKQMSGTNPHTPVCVLPFSLDWQMRTLDDSLCKQHPFHPKRCQH